MVLFFIGVVEMLIVTAWTKAVTRTKIVASGIITMVNVLIWYYVLQTIVDNINNWSLALLYALGCALGTVVSTYYFHLKENNRINLLNRLQNIRKTTKKYANN